MGSLVLHRVVGESIILDIPGRPAVVITVDELRGRGVRLRVTAEEEVRIWRAEVLEGRHREGQKQAAAGKEEAKGQPESPAGTEPAAAQGVD